MKIQIPPSRPPPIAKTISLHDIGLSMHQLETTSTCRARPNILDHAQSNGLIFFVFIMESGIYLPLSESSAHFVNIMWHVWSTMVQERQFSSQISNRPNYENLQRQYRSRNPKTTAPFLFFSFQMGYPQLWEVSELHLMSFC